MTKSPSLYEHMDKYTRRIMDTYTLRYFPALTSHICVGLLICISINFGLLCMWSTLNQTQIIILILKSDHMFPHTEILILGKTIKARWNVLCIKMWCLYHEQGIGWNDYLCSQWGKRQLLFSSPNGVSLEI